MIFDTDIASDGVDLLIPEYQETPRIQAWLASFLDGSQEVETALSNLYDELLSIDNGTGDRLDQIGLLLNEARNGRADAAYRAALRVRRLVNISDGTSQQLMAIAYLLESVASETGAYVDMQDVPPAHAELTIVRTPVNDAHTIKTLLEQARAAGVWLTVIVTPISGDFAQSATNPATDAPTDLFKLSRAADYPESSSVGLLYHGEPVWSGNFGQYRGGTLARIAQ